MTFSASKQTCFKTCSFGACCEHPRYEWGIQIVGSPKISVKLSFGSDPARFGTRWGSLFEVFFIEDDTKSTQGCFTLRRVASNC